MTERRKRQDDEDAQWFKDLGVQLAHGMASGSQVERVLREIVQQNPQPGPSAATPGIQHAAGSTESASDQATEEHEPRPSPEPRPRRTLQRGRFVVDCPACLGTGKVPRPNSIVLHGCMLCWERGVVSSIVAERWRHRDEPQQQSPGRGESESA